MTFLRLFCATAVATVLSMTLAHAKSCSVQHPFRGLVFDAGAYVATDQMERYLDQALTYGVEKSVLFPHPDAHEGNQPLDLEEVFPDLVVQGDAPWNDADPIYWSEPLHMDRLSGFADEVTSHPDRAYLLSHISRFDVGEVKRMVKSHPNLWIGFGKPEIEAMLKTCATGPVATLMRAADGRVVFSSYGGDEQWKNYKWTQRKLKRLSTYLSPKEADALLFKNAEELYNLAVNAP